MKQYLLFLMLFAFANEVFTQNPPPIHFEEISHLFDVLSQSESYTFKFQNVSKMPVSILTVSSDCECLTFKWGISPVMPDSFGYVSVDYNAKKDSSVDREYKISVTNSKSLLPTELKIGKKIAFTQELPKPINMGEVRKAIGYPPVAREANIQGQVMLRILVDEKGNYMRHIVSKAAHPLLQLEVEKHVHELRFTPNLQNGKPIKCWVNIPFNFKLEEETKKEKKRWGRK